jgi:hypothetical protein
LYSLAASTTGVFNDILTGDNKVPCTQGSTGCPTAAPFQFGFSAGPGYDMVTGLGSVDVTNLTNAWAGLTVTPDFTLFGYSATATAPGQQATSQIVVESLAGFSGTVDLTCQPSSTSAQITCSISPTSVTVGGTGATATMTISTTAPHILPGASASLRTHGWGWLATSGGVLFGGVFLVGLPLNRRRRIAGLGVMLLVFFAAGVGCGGGSSSSSTPKNVGTAAGSYSITVTATSTSPALSHTANVSVTVQ